jgi:tRNA-Thr(GGU) m(6)t(6)A37 methyltransferase TsaA
MADSDMRAGEIAGTLPAAPDAEVYFIGTIRTPWHSRAECPKRGTFDGPLCSLVIDERWRLALTGIEKHQRLQVLYWMDQARRDLVLQAPRLGTLAGTFALRSPVRPNPIASSIVEFVSVRDNIVEVRGLDCLDGTPLIDLKPERGRHESAS